MTLIFLLLLLLVVYFTFAHFYPVRGFKAKFSSFTPNTFPNLYLYSFEIHLHSQFSYDSLGKPEDITRTAIEEDIDYVIVTDHENDYIRHFTSSRIIAGVERKITDEKGQILGDLLVVEDIKVVAHPFKEKYRWRLELPEDYLFELVNLKDALLERKALLALFMPYMLLRGLFSINWALEPLKRLIDVEKYLQLYMKMGIKNPIVGGLDHHVKLYIREVGIRFLFPHYRHSFRLMRNFLISDERVTEKRDFLRFLKKGNLLISFSQKPTLYWKEGQRLRVLPPEDCLLLKFTQRGKECYTGSYFEVEPSAGINLFIGYTYKLRLGWFYLGLKPLFVFLWKEEHNGRDATA